MKLTEKKTIVVGMSGGVDSSVVAVMLKEEGHNVIGIFMKNWEELDEHGVCKSSLEFKDVENVCLKFDIPYYSVDFIEEYRENVFKHFVSEYENGYTPNPDILCNREIKFKVFFEKAMELGADYLATGHYCRVEKREDRYALLKGLDPKKDQSYFLSAIDGVVLDRVLFPIGDLEKTKVRELAQKYNLITQNKKDSTGICFIGERNFKNFLSNYIQFSAGEFRKLNEDIVGEHTGAAYYTIGQRKGLGLGGPGEPWFVVDKDIKKNIVYVERGEEHPALYSSVLTASEFTLINPINLTFPFDCTAKIRYRQADQECKILSLENGEIQVEFKLPQRAITPRQSIVFYRGDECIGQAMIINRGKSLYELNLISNT